MVNVKIDCSQCKKHCCSCLPLEVENEELQRLLKKYPNILTEEKLKIFLSRTYIMPPCPFFDSKTNLCMIYEDRPLSCEQFPMGILDALDENNEDKNNLIFVALLFCEQSPSLIGEGKKYVLDIMLDAVRLNILLIPQVIHLTQKERNADYEDIKDWLKPYHQLTDTCIDIAKMPVKQFQQLLTQFYLQTKDISNNQERNLMLKAGLEAFKNFSKAKNNEKK